VEKLAEMLWRQQPDRETREAETRGIWLVSEPMVRAADKKKPYAGLSRRCHSLIDAAVRTIAGSARSMGVDVEGA
jgi:hypothetical protein